VFLRDIKHYKKRSCQYKVKLLSLKDGLKHLFQTRNRGIDVDACYKCVFCNGYHIGHYPKQKNKQRRNRKLVTQYLYSKLDN
jgi:hypothetical protein